MPHCDLKHPRSRSWTSKCAAACHAGVSRISISFPGVPGDFTATESDSHIYSFLKTNELKWMSWYEWLEMNELKWMSWNEWNDMKELKWRNWNEWIEINELTWVTCQKWSETCFFLRVLCDQLLGDDVVDICAFCRPHLPKGLSDPQFF